MLTLFVLLVSVAVTVVLFCRMNNVTFREAKLNSVFWLTTSLLVFLIPLVLYKALALWLEGPSSPYPDIDQAWKAGLRELQRKGLDLRQIPLFLVVGSTSEQQERAIFQSAAAEFLVSGAPEGNASLHWYAHADAVYRRRQPGLLSQRAGPKQFACGRVSARSAGCRGGGAGPRSISARRYRSAACRGRSAPMPPRRRPRRGPRTRRRRARSSNDVRGTIMGPPTAATSIPSASASAPDRNIQTDKSFFEEQRKRFGWLCRLIRRWRLPYAPINGVLALLPFGYVQSGKPGSAKGVERLLAFRSGTGPGRAHDPLSRDRAGDRPGRGAGLPRVHPQDGPPRRPGMGQGTPLRLEFPPGHPRHRGPRAKAGGPPGRGLRRLGSTTSSTTRSRSCGARATPAYTLFWARSASRSGTWGRSSAAFPICTPTPRGPSAEVIYFAGCYFAGTGKTDERQVFIKRVLEKPVEQQEELEWTAAALREDGRYQWLGLMASAVDTVLFLGFVAVGVLWWMGYKP